jgi:hypothetical protein
VLANKKPLAGVVGRYRALRARRGAAPQIKYEATVGAGLPIIDTYHKLVETGDRVLRSRLRQRHADVRRLGRSRPARRFRRRCARP